MADKTSKTKTKPKRLSKGWRTHMRRVKQAAAKLVLPTASRPGRRVKE